MQRPYFRYMNENEAAQYNSIDVCVTESLFNVLRVGIHIGKTGTRILFRDKLNVMHTI